VRTSMIAGERMPALTLGLLPRCFRYRVSLDIWHLRWLTCDVKKKEKPQRILCGSFRCRGAVGDAILHPLGAMELGLLLLNPHHAGLYLFCGCAVTTVEEHTRKDGAYGRGLI